MADLVVVEKQKQTGRLFTREFKLSIVEWYYNNDTDILQTANMFKSTENKYSLVPNKRPHLLVNFRYFCRKPKPLFFQNIVLLK